MRGACTRLFERSRLIVKRPVLVVVAYYESIGAQMPPFPKCGNSEPSRLSVSTYGVVCRSLTGFGCFIQQLNSGEFAMVVM